MTLHSVSDNKYYVKSGSALSDLDTLAAVGGNVWQTDLCSGKKLGFSSRESAYIL